MTWATLHAAIRRHIPDWARQCVPLAVKERLTPAVTGPMVEVREHLPPWSPFRRRKRALVSYILPPFRMAPSNPRNVEFSNIGIARDMVRALNELGYIVEVIEWTDQRFPVRRRYDLFIGHGGVNMPGLLAKLPAAAVKIYFATGIYWQDWNRRETERFDALERRRGARPPYDRMILNPEEEATRGADAILCLGNESAGSSYAGYPQVILLNNAAYPVTDAPPAREFAEARRHFLFFAGPGSVHKGLDLLLEVFSRSDCHLHVCQDMPAEFRRLFRRELEDCANIHAVGPISMRTPAFLELARRCAYVIQPSCAEGQPGGVVECMHYGLIPVVSRECNITTGDFGVTLKNCSLEEIGRTVRELSQQPPERCAEMSRRTLRAAAAEFSEEAFLRNVKSAVEKIVAKKRK